VTVKPSYTERKPNVDRLHFDRPINILIAEDNHINQDLVGIVLKSLGATFEFANNGHEAVTMFNKNKYDLVIMDVQMPIMSGLDATKNIRKVDQDVPIIALTANVYKEDIDICKASGMNDHLPKPFTDEQIFEAVQNWVIKRLKYIDISYLKKIGFGDASLIEELGSKIIAQNRLFLNNYKISVDIEDWAAVSSIVHQWKSTSKIIGIGQLQDLLKSIEAALDTMEGGFDYNTQYDRLQEICDGVELEMKSLVAC
ncbi:MAG TPA: response regulator, partial [Cytophagaceae bacterium]